MMDIKHKFCRPAMRVCGIFLVLAANAFAAEPTYKTGETIFIETGVEAPDRSPTWYA